ncbi:MAG: hypothetical protein DRP95_00170, partial [Candidatus Latescibacterota bacterium]
KIKNLLIYGRGYRSWMPLGAKKIQNLRAEVKGVGSTFMVRVLLRLLHLLRCSVVGFLSLRYDIVGMRSRGV